MAEALPVLTACSYGLFHAPFFTVEHGTTPACEREANPDSSFLKCLPGSLRSFPQCVAYPPNQAFIGNVDPLRLPPRPWYSAGEPAARVPAASQGAFGAILDETMLYAMMKLADMFEIVALEKGFRDAAAARLAADDATRGADLTRFGAGVDAGAVASAVSQGALPLVLGGKTVGCVKAAHPSDPNLAAHTMLENLASKATAVYALRRLLIENAVDPLGIDYIIETSEEACGDMNQRGGGNFAKAIGELCGLSNATGSDIRSFCAGPVHGLLHAAALVKAGTFRRVVVTAGGTTAKLAMNAKKHLEKGLPALEDCMGSFALLVEADAAQGLLIGAVGYHKIGSGSSPQAVMQDLVADPLSRAGLSFADVDRYAPELQNPEITESAGAGNVTLANLKMIAAMAVMKKQIDRGQMDSFIEAHGMSGWAPTQGHIPSGIPALGWFLRWAREGTLRRGMVIGKGSLFLGRMTNLFDGVSLLLEARGAKDRPAQREAEAPARAAERPAPAAAAPSAGGTLRIGLTLPGFESDEQELHRGAAEAQAADPAVVPVLLGSPGSSPQAAHREMEQALADGSIQAAVTFHYPFPIGVATVGHTTAPGNGRDLFIATTTGTASTDRVWGLVRNVVAGIAAAKAFGIGEPRVGLLNLDGAASALKILEGLAARGWHVNLAGSGRGDALLRGNDILAGSVDVLVCDSLSGNAIVKLLAAFSTGGRIEMTGSGYGPGVGVGAAPVGIISRATGAAVVARAIALMARMIRGGLYGLYEQELAQARRAGLEEAAGGPGGARRAASAAHAPSGPSPSAALPGGPARKVVHHEIEGIDVLEIERAVEILASAGVYCEPGMGCTGPVVMVAEEDAAQAVKRLASAGLL